MADIKSGNKGQLFSNIQRYILTGILTLIPLWITWLVFRFLFTELSKLGAPWVRTLARTVEEPWPTLANFAQDPWFQSILAVLFSLLALYLLGWAATQVVGKRLIRAVDDLIGRIPMAQTIYGATKKLIGALQSEPGTVRRVVLIKFPSDSMKTVGFVTRVLRDDRTGEQLAAVYVPTTPNPTSGYLEIVPLDEVVPTDWTMDEAMTFIMSGGAVAPDNLTYRKYPTEQSESPWNEVPPV